MKKLLIVLLAVISLFSVAAFFGCSSNTGNPPAADENVPQNGKSKFTGLAFEDKTVTRGRI